MYELPQYNFSQVKQQLRTIFTNRAFLGLVLLLVLVVGAGFVSGKISWPIIQKQVSEWFDRASSQSIAPVLQEAPSGQYVSTVGYEQAIIDAVKKASPSVVSIIIS